MLTGLLLIITCLAVFSGMMYVQQPDMVFFPDPVVDKDPSSWGYSFEEVSFVAEDDTRLHGWYIPYPKATRNLLFFHGNAGNISHRQDSIRTFHDLGLNVFIFDYRGYGKSAGQPSEQGLYEDARAAWAYLVEKRHVPDYDVIVFGRSLGAAVAARLAAQVRPQAVILESAFSSARDMAHEIFPILSNMVVLRFGFDTVSQVRKLSSPIMILHSPDDEIVPFSLGQKVYQAANEPKIFFTMKGGHNNGFLLSEPDYSATLRRFIANPGLQSGGILK